MGTITKEKGPYGGFFFLSFKAVLKVGTHTILPFRRLFKETIGKLYGRPLGTIRKEKGPYEFNLLSMADPIVTFCFVLLFSVGSLTDSCGSLLFYSSSFAKGMLVHSPL